MAEEHLDHALEEVFAGHGETIHALKVSNAHFRGLMERNHAVWKEIRHIEDGVEAASDERLRNLHKERLRLLDEIAGMVRAKEG